MSESMRYHDRLYERMLDKLIAPLGLEIGPRSIHLDHIARQPSVSAQVPIVSKVRAETQSIADTTHTQLSRLFER